MEIGNCSTILELQQKKPPLNLCQVHGIVKSNWLVDLKALSGRIGTREIGVGLGALPCTDLKRIKTLNFLLYLTGRQANGRPRQVLSLSNLGQEPSSWILKQMMMEQG